MVGSPVVVTVAYPVAPGEEEAFHGWARLRMDEAAQEPGYLGGSVLAPDRSGPAWYVVHRFRNEYAARNWAGRFARSPGAEPALDVRWEAPPRRTRPVVVPRSPDPLPEPAPAGPAPIDQAPTGPAPTGPAAAGPASARAAPLGPAPAGPGPAGPAAAPPRWKMAVVTLAGVFPPVLLLNLTLVPALGDASTVLRSAALCVGVTVLTTWGTMPRLTRWLRGWLSPLTGRHRPAPTSRVPR